MICPHCDAVDVLEQHFRDSGNLTPEQAEQLGYCPTLAAGRHPRPIRWTPTERRLQVAEDHQARTTHPDIEAALYAEALARAALA